MNSGRFSLLILRRGLWALTGVVAVGFGAAMLWHLRTPRDLPAPRITGEAAITNAYALTDHAGRTVTADSFDGQ